MKHYQTVVTWIFRTPDPNKPDKYTIANYVTDKANKEARRPGTPYAYLTVGPAISKEANVRILLVQVGILLLLLLIIVTEN